MPELSKIDLAMFRIEKKYAFWLGVVKYAAWISIAWIVCDGIKEIVSHSPEQIGALAALVKAFSVWFSSKKLPEYAGWLLALLFFVAWRWERSGKKRAIKKLGECRKQLEDNDPGGRTSSGLSVTGETPKD